LHFTSDSKYTLILKLEKIIRPLQKQKFLLEFKNPVKAGFILWKYAI